MFYSDTEGHGHEKEDFLERHEDGGTKKAESSRNKRRNERGQGHVDEGAERCQTAEC